MKKTHRGQTLVECLIAMTIISIASLILLKGVTAGARVLIKAADMREAESSLGIMAEQQISEKDEFTEETITVEINGESQIIQVRKITVSDPEKSELSYSFYYTDEGAASP